MLGTPCLEHCHMVEPVSISAHAGVNTDAYGPTTLWTIQITDVCQPGLGGNEGVHQPARLTLAQSRPPFRRGSLVPHHPAKARVGKPRRLLRKRINALNKQTCSIGRLFKQQKMSRPCLPRQRCSKRATLVMASSHTARANRRARQTGEQIVPGT